MFSVSNGRHRLAKEAIIGSAIAGLPIKKCKVFSSISDFNTERNLSFVIS